MGAWYASREAVTGPFPTPVFSTIAVVSGGSVSGGLAVDSLTVNSGGLTISGPLAVGSAVSATQAPQAQQVLGGNAATYHNVTGSRALGTTYTNNNGKPIFVMLEASSTAISQIIPTVAGVALPGSTIQVTGSNNGLMFIVPAGTTYSVSVNVGTASLISWFELY